jgi:uncharacterized protein (TIGR04255 family)
MANYPNAPLVYTIGVVRFPTIPEFERFTDKFLDQIREDYPFSEKVDVPVVTANFGPEGLSVKQQQTPVFIFSDAEKRWSFIFAKETFGLQTFDYKTHTDFLERFKYGLEKLLAIPTIGIKLMTSAGIRYVDLIVPRADEKLSDYVQSWALPEAPQNVFTSSPEDQGMYITNHPTEMGALRIQVLRNPPGTLPPELRTEIAVSSGRIPEKPSRDFALLDLDHGCSFDPPVELTAEIGCQKLLELRTVARKAFDMAGTEHAHQVWKEKRS